MKFILVISLLFSLLISSESRLVVGSFQHEDNAKKMKANIEKIIANDEDFKSFLDENSIGVTYKLLGQYYAVSFEPFNDSKTKFITYFKIKKRYSDTYSLDINAQDEKQFIAAALEEEKSSTPEPDDTKVEVPTPLEAKQNNEVKIPTPLKDTQATKPEVTETKSVKPAADKISTSIMKEKPEVESNNKLSYLIPLLVAILILVILIVYFTQKKPKKTLQTLKEDFEEDLA